MVISWCVGLLDIRIKKYPTKNIFFFESLKIPPVKYVNLRHMYTVRMSDNAILADDQQNKANINGR